MKQLRYGLWALVAAMLTVGCVNHNPDEVVPGGDNEVKLWGGVHRAPGVQYRSSTRGTAASTSGIIDPAYAEELPIGVARVSKLLDADIFPDFRSLEEPMAARLGLPDAANSYYRPIEFLHQAQFFPDAYNELRYVGWYPWNESDHIGSPMVDDDGSTYFSDDKKTEVTVAITGDKDVMYGEMIEGSLSTGFPVMEFNHALCLYRIYAYAMVGGVTIEGEDDAPLTAEQWGSLETMTLKDLPSQVSMVLPHRCVEEGVGHSESPDEFTLLFSGERDFDLHDESNNIFFDAPEELPLGIGEAVLVSKCIAGPPTSGVMSIAVSTSLQTALQDVSIARNFKPGHAYDIVLRFSDHGLINADVSVGEWTVHDMELTESVAANLYYDLSANETANSYMVSSANYAYCFDGTVKGNGEGELLNMSESDIHLNVGWVDVIWDDIDPFDHDGDPATEPIESFQLQSNRLSEGKVLFDLFGHTSLNPDGTVNTDDKGLPVEGNVIVGGYDKNPAEGGKLLWTWHIWVTDKVKAIGCSSGYVIQDRNLGATEAVPSVGGFADETHGLFYQWGRPTPLKREDLAVSTDLVMLDNLYPTNNPNTLFGSGSVDHAWIDSNSPWFEHHDHLWGEMGVAFERHVKTLYDPCPPGYFVTNHTFWQGIEEYEVSFDAHKGVELKMVNDSFWLPHTGVINDSGTASDNFDGVALRTSTIDYTNPGMHTPYYLAYTASKTAKVSSENSWGNYAYAVRCIATATDPVLVDLSESQTANCYMVNAPGYYKFKATVRGNGVSQLMPSGGTNMLNLSDGMDVNIKPAKVDLLWWQGDFTEVSNTAEDIDKLMCINLLDGGVPDSEGYVMFHVEELHAGNAILAAYDVDGEILWTWHLWITTTRPADIDSGKRTLQDRYLGATQAPVIVPRTSLTFTDYTGAASTDLEAVWATFGFYYQWGRKDPILGAPIGGTTETVSGNTIATSTYWLKDYTTGTWSMQATMPTAGRTAVNASVKDPLKFYTCDATANGNSPGGQWMDDSMADGVKNVALWGYAVEGYDIGQDFSKTMYDPCPPGYRTAFHDVWKLQVGNNYYFYGSDDSGVPTGADSNNNKGSCFWTRDHGAGGNGAYSWEEFYTDYGFVTSIDYFDEAFFPYAGARMPRTGGYAEVQTHGFLNTGMPYNAYNTRTFRYRKTVSETYWGYGYSEQVCNSGTDIGFEQFSHPSSYGKTVRCMKE